MYSQLERYVVQKLREQNMPQDEVGSLTGISERSISRIEKEEQIKEIDEERFRKSHNMGRPSRVSAYEEQIRQWLDEPRYKEDGPSYNYFWCTAKETKKGISFWESKSTTERYTMTQDNLIEFKTPESQTDLVSKKWTQP
jgi:transcriptional regulator with XRE-family HTH domain